MNQQVTPSDEVVNFEIPGMPFTDDQRNAAALQVLRAMDGLPVSTVIAVLEQAKFFLLACTALDCSSSDFDRAEQGFGGAHGQ
jgi:hypothetical protein